MTTSTLPVTRYHHGRTFAVALAVLAALGIAQFGALGWVFFTRSRGAGAMAKVDVQAAATAEAELREARASVGGAGVEKAPAHVDLPQLLAAPTPWLAAKTLPVMPMALPRPTPLQESQEPMTPAAQLSDLVDQAHALRERGDTGTALIRLREAQVVAPRNPQVISELAATYESMGQTEKAAEYWRRVYEMGIRAGVYYTAAAAKVNPVPALSASVDQEEPGLQPGMKLGILEVRKDELEASDAARHLVLHIPIKARVGNPVNANDVFIQVLFFDLLADASVAQTTADVKSRWATAPVDWTDFRSGVLDVEYVLPKAPKPTEQRQYFGYVASVYYKGDLQDWRADPVKLREMSPPPTTQDATGEPAPALP